MTNIEKITVNGTSYDVEDSVARNATEDIKANYANKSFMQFRTNRSLKQKLKQNINEKKVDAFLVN